MKNSKPYLLLFVSLIILVLIYITIRSNDSIKQDLYELNSGFYLEKKDYFSKYAIIMKSDENFQLIVSDVKELYVFNEECLVKYKENSKEKFLYFSDETENQIITDHLNDLKGLINPDEIVWKKPWQIVELKTLNNSNKLISQIVLILIILLGFYIIMKVFNIRRLT